MTGTIEGQLTGTQVAPSRSSEYRWVVVCSSLSEAMEVDESQNAEELMEID